MKERLSRETVAMRVAKEFKDGYYVNLGFGLPTLCSLFIPEGRTIIFHTENGALGFGRVLGDDDSDIWNVDLVNASGQFVAPTPGMCFFDSALSFAMIRSGHVDMTVLGAYEVSEKGDLASWTRTFDLSEAIIGGAMDMVIGPKKVVIAMEHNREDGTPKIVKSCRFPLTARKCVNMIVTDLAVIDVTDKGLLLKEVAPGWSVEEVKKLTEADLVVAKDVSEIEL